MSHPPKLSAFERSKAARIAAAARFKEGMTHDDSACDPESAIWTASHLLFNRNREVRKFAADAIHDAMERILQKSRDLAEQADRLAEQHSDNT